MNKYFKAMVVLSPLLLMSGCFPPGGGKALAQAVCTTEAEITKKVNNMYQFSFHVTPSMTRMDHDVAVLFDKVYSADKNVPAETDLKEILVFSDGANHAFLVFMDNKNCATVTSKITDEALARYLTLGDV